jgi:hypothetical protein
MATTTTAEAAYNKKWTQNSNSYGNNFNHSNTNTIRNSNNKETTVQTNVTEIYRLANFLK